MECHVCLEVFNNTERRPKVLPCGHTFCLQCLQQLRAKRSPLDFKVFRPSPEKLANNYSLLQQCNKPAESPLRGFWCRGCNREATAECVDEHPANLCSTKKARTEDAGPLLEQLQQGEAALASLGVKMEGAALAIDLAGCRAQLERERAELAAARARLQEQGVSAAAWEETKKQAAALKGVRQIAAQLVPDLDDPSAQCAVVVRRGAAGEVAWRGEVRLADRAEARLLLGQLACSGGLQREEQRPAGGPLSKDDALKALMSSLWELAGERARCAHRPALCDCAPGWDLKVPAPLEKSHLLDALGALATALAVERLREAAEVGAMVLLLHKQLTDSRCLLSLSVRSLEVRDQGKGQPVEALLMVRLVEVGSNDGELLAQAFLSLCERSNVLWQAMLVGVSVEGAGQEGKAFMQTLRAATGANITQLPNTGLPLEDRVAFACYDPPLDETRPSVPSQFFGVLDWLRRLFAVDGQWFPLLRDSCTSLTERDIDPWRSYATSIVFVFSELNFILEALSHLAHEEPMQFQVAAALNESLRFGGFVVCLASFRHLFEMVKQFFEQAGITPDIQLDKVKQMPANPLMAEALTQSLVTRVRSSIGHTIPEAEEKDLISVVSECVALTAAAVEAVRCQAVDIAAVLGQPVSEAVPAAEYGPEFAAEMAQLRAALGDHQHANLYAALQSHNVKDVKRRFPALYARVVHAFVLPLIPPWGPRADQQLQELCERTASCPVDRLNDFAVLVAHHREEPPLQAALRLMAEGSK